jgi:hypothetical protein
VGSGGGRSLMAQAAQSPHRAPCCIRALAGGGGGSGPQGDCPIPSPYRSPYRSLAAPVFSLASLSLILGSGMAHRSLPLLAGFSREDPQRHSGGRAARAECARCTGTCVSGVACGRRRLDWAVHSFADCAAQSVRLGRSFFRRLCSTIGGPCARAARRARLARLEDGCGAPVTRRQCRARIAGKPEW